MSATINLNALSPAALEAAMRGGTEGWGQHGSAGHVRYCEAIPRKPGGRRKCCCGCGGHETHRGMANGVSLMGGCEFSVRGWVRDPMDAYRRINRLRGVRSE